MQIFIALLFTALLAVVIVLVSKWRRDAIAKLYNQYREKDNSYTLILKKGESGFYVSKIIVNTDSIESFSQAAPEAKDFTVNGTNGGTQKTVPVTAAYLCDIDGTDLEQSKQKDPEVHLALELDKDMQQGLSPEDGTLSFEIRHNAFEPITECSEWFCPDKEEQKEFEKLTKDIS